MAEMLAQVPDTLDKREGSIMYNAVAPLAHKYTAMMERYEQFMQDTFADTAEGVYLSRRTQELGIERKEAKQAVRKGIFAYQDGTAYNVAPGIRFVAMDELYPLTYVVTEKLEDGVYGLTCKQAGEVGNYPVGNLLPVDYLSGLATAILSDILTAGSDVETDDSLRKRYFARLKGQAYGGNIADYQEKVNAIDGVGGVKVYPVYNGGGTVKLVIIDDDFEQPGAVLVNQVQTLVDPEENAGQGYGLAPIGHTVTVEAVAAVTIHISCSYTLMTGYVWEDVQQGLETAYGAYLAELRKSWESSSQLVVRTAYLDTRALSVVGILDVAHTMINGQEDNLVLDDTEIPVLGTVVPA